MTTLWLTGDHLQAPQLICALQMGDKCIPSKKKSSDNDGKDKLKESKMCCDTKSSVQLLQVERTCPYWVLGSWEEKSKQSSYDNYYREQLLPSCKNTITTWRAGTSREEEHPDGFVSLTEKDEQFSIKTLKDTGASQSLIIQTVSPLSDQTSMATNAYTRSGAKYCYCSNE